MTNLTYLYQALALARETVKNLERAIEASTRAPSEPTGPYTNAGANGNYSREDFYDWVEENDR